MWMGQYANSWRSGPDHHNSWDQPTYGTASIIEHNADLGKYAGVLNFRASQNEYHISAIE